MIYDLPDDLGSDYSAKNLIVNTHVLNLRAGPGTEYIITESLFEYQILVFLAIKGEWVKVKVKQTGNIGFVHYNYVLLES